MKWDFFYISSNNNIKKITIYSLNLKRKNKYKKKNFLFSPIIKFNLIKREKNAKDIFLISFAIVFKPLCQKFKHKLFYLILLL